MMRYSRINFLLSVLVLALSAAQNDGYMHPIHYARWGGTVKPTECGKTPIRPNLNGFIIGGVEARPNSLPWQVALGQYYYDTFLGIFKKKKYYGTRCGGSIVSKRIVITAAHCIHPGEEKFYVIVGGHNLGGDPAKDPEGPYAKKYLVDKVIKHPNWDPSDLSIYDIAVLVLEKDIKFNAGVQPICLPEAGTASEHLYKKGNNGVVSGWGRSENRYKEPKLRQLVMPFYPECEVMPYHDIHAAVTCAGYPEGGRDSCVGDSGGPLATVDKKKNNRWTLVGVVSYGYGCAAEGMLGVYTRVSSYMDFINTYVKT